jgi:hypothetical protein
MSFLCAFSSYGMGPLLKSARTPRESVARGGISTSDNAEANACGHRAGGKSFIMNDETTMASW